MVDRKVTFKQISETPVIDDRLDRIQGGYRLQRYVKLCRVSTNPIELVKGVLGGSIEE